MVKVEKNEISFAKQAAQAGDIPYGGEKMSTKRYLVLLALAFLAIGLAACTLSASTPPPASSTADSAMQTLDANLSNIATQTAAAGGGGEAIPTATATAGSVDTGGAPATTEPPPPPPPPEKTAIPEATPGIPKTYKLEKGEFPFCIARRFDVDVGELLSLNGLNLNSVVSVGYTLKIPQTGHDFDGDRSLKKHPTTYEVLSGDTIFSIACKYGDVDPYLIAKINDLGAPYTLKAGRKLDIP
ncbi:MAG: hypothetical protein A2Z45_03215 [Chloroflexi bacterium RBG_19FT_COMBO_55_16]|nr:MAG: hypothetical protein A2Z45_03215 [Chloroflexi bacterium RBG_19FT_COMBO_55_16]